MRHLMLAASILVLAATQASAQRTDTRQHTCQQIYATVQHYGSVVLTTGPNRYDRYVGFQNYCQGSQVAHKAYAPTIDNPRCYIGFQCKERLFD